MDKGYIKLHRKILDWYGFKSSSRLKLWITLLVLANHEDKNILFNGKPMKIKRGTFLTSRKKISIITSISESWVENLLKEFILQQQIRQQSCPSSRLITILNYELHEKKDSKKDSQLDSQLDSGLDTTKHYNIKEYNNISIVSQLMDYFKSCFSKKFNVNYITTQPKDNSILKRLSKVMQAGEIKTLIDRFFDSDDKFICGTNYGIGVFMSQINKLQVADKPKQTTREL